jgi:hypothetical protein
VHCISSHSGSVLSSIYVGYTIHARIHVAEGHICGGRVCDSLPAAFGRCKYVVYILSCMSLGCPLGWPAGIRSIFSVGEQPPSVWHTRGPPKVLPMCSRLLGWLPSDEIPGVFSLGCALVTVRACLLMLLCFVHLTKFLSRPSWPIQSILLSYRVSDTRVPYCLVYRSSNQPDVAGMM